MEQARALNALEPFLALSKSAMSPRAAADLVVRATSAPNTYIFTELLDTPQVQALASSAEFAPFLNLLQIFSHGTYSTYTSTDGLPPINDVQRLKLRQLSLLTLARKDGSTANATPPALDYASLQTALDLPTRQALEELIISAIYAGLLQAQLNPQASLVQINSVAPLRDVAPTAIGDLLYSLQAWAGRCDATLEFLSQQMTQLRADADRRAARAAARAEETHKLMEKEQKGGKLPDHATSTSNADTTVARHAARTHYPHPSSTITTTNSMNSMLTVGGGSSSSSNSNSGLFAPDGGAARTRSQVTATDGELVDISAHNDDAEADDMEVDDEDDPDGTTTAGKRKLAELMAGEGPFTT